jgi:hypothetical protein
MFVGILDAVTSNAKALSPVTSLFTPGVGAALGGIGSYIGITGANKANQQMVQNQMNFQEEMSNTSYQRAVEDMKKAGLSPMLAYQQGGASTPGGASATMDNVLGNATNTAIASANAMQDLRNKAEQEKSLIAGVENTEANTANTRADTVNKILTAPNISAENKRILADVALKNTTADLNSAMAYNQKHLLAPSPRIWARGVDEATEVFNKIKANPGALVPFGSIK